MTGVSITPGESLTPLTLDCPGHSGTVGRYVSYILDDIEDGVSQCCMNH